MNAIERACYLSAALIAAADLAWAGPPFRTDDPEPVDLDHWEIDVFSTATHVHGDTSGVLPGIEVNYGLLKGHAGSRLTRRGWRRGRSGAR